MEKRTILIQLDTDAQPSVFDRVVAIDAGADEVFSYGGVTADNVQSLVHGAIFTRGPKDLKRTALFIGGSNVAAGERLLQAALQHMIPQFGLRVSVLLDVNGANTTAAAAVWAASQHISLRDVHALVLGAGAVGQRVARLLAAQGANVRIGSLDMEQSAQACAAIQQRHPSARVTAVACVQPQELADAVAGQALIVAAATAGVTVLPKSARPTSLKVAIDLNAVPPLGIEGIGVGESGVQHDGVVFYGAIGVGNLKMKLHRAAIARLFGSNDQILDAEEVFAIPF